MLKQMTYCAGLLFLAILVPEDIREKKISLNKLLPFAVSGLFYRLSVSFGFEKNGEIIMCLIPGGILILLAILTHEAIGFGDGVVVLILGLWTGGLLTVKAVSIGIMLSGICGCVLLVMKKKEPIPFIPFLLMGMEVSLLYV